MLSCLSRSTAISLYFSSTFPPKDSPPKLEDSLWVENPLAGILNVCTAALLHSFDTLARQPDHARRVLKHAFVDSASLGEAPGKVAGAVTLRASTAGKLSAPRL